MKKHSTGLCLTLFLAFTSITGISQSLKSVPNILLLVADDLAYTDLGCYGGEIYTPNLDRLAAQGLRFSRYHTAPMCAPTRAMLLSGNDNHIAGVGRQGARTDHFGYEGSLSERIATIPEVLREVGYHTYMAGKWHLGDDEHENPHARGFERSFILKHGAGNHYDDTGLFARNPKSQYTEDGLPAKWPEGAYSTDFYTDKLIEYIGGTHGDGKPFFAFAAYTSPHWPLQVDEEYWKQYEGDYDEGYEVLREKRLKSIIAAGMVSPEVTLPEVHQRVKPWAELNPEEQKKESRKMELYAGMVTNLDHNIGRLLDYLRDIGEYENTLIVFVSDNGAAAEDFYYSDFYGQHLRQHFTDNYEAMGLPNSFISYGPQWAEAGNAPFRYYKGYTFEGGVVAPMIVAGPGVVNAGAISHEFATVQDIAPTFYEMAGATYPDQRNGKTLHNLPGSSMASHLQGRAAHVHSEDSHWFVEHMSRTLVMKGDWKLVGQYSEENGQVLSLYNLSADPSEQVDMSEVYRDKFEELKAIWESEVTSKEVLFPLPD